MRRRVKSAALTLCAAVLLWNSASSQELGPDQQLVRSIFKELIEMDTSSEAGDTARAADAMAARLRSAGFKDPDIKVFKPAPRKGNLIVRLRGSGTKKPILLLAHLDVVPARRDDWSFDPFSLTEKDGFYYGRGAEDDKFMAASFVSNLIRYKKEGYRPERDIIVALTADEEIGGGWGVQWLLRNHRELIEAEFALNEGAGITLQRGAPIRIFVSIAEKIAVNFRVEATDKGGHSSLPRPENPIYRLAAALDRLSKLVFPLKINEANRGYFEESAKSETIRTAADIRAVLSGNLDPAAEARLSARTGFNARLRTTCVPTILEGGHASNALPQTARATINCRVMPGETVEEIRGALIRAISDEGVSVSRPQEPVNSAPSVLTKSLLSIIESTAAEFWPGAPVIPAITPGSTDSRLLRDAGIPSFGHSGLALDETRAHGKDERVSIRSFFEGNEYLYRLIKRLAGES